MFVKIKILFSIKVFLLTNQKKDVVISSRWEKIPTQRDQKQCYIRIYNVKYRRREEAKTLEDKSQVYIVRLFILLVS